MLAPTCPQCPQPVGPVRDGFACDVHGPVVPLWRAQAWDYDTFAGFLGRADGLPAYLPWPLLIDWTVADFGVVGEHGGRPSATVLSVRGPTRLDGEVELTVVHEQPRVGLGARCARVDVPPEDVVAGRPPDIKVRADGHPTPLWMLPEGAGEPLEQASFVGADRGRWLWLMVRPASAAMLLRDEWILGDAGGLGPEALDLPFGSGGATGW